MTKLIIQIPCFNEAETIGSTLDALPRTITGVDKVEVLIIDDGSSDATVAVARAHGANHVVAFPRNRGLARAFVAGLEECVHLGADVIVNTDADNQYFGGDIDKLVGPVLARKADIVVGARPIGDISHFSPTKKFLQRLGSWVVRLASNTRVDDAPSGFRAFSREAARQLNVFSEYTYTLETIIQAGQKGMTVLSVPIRVNGETRPSRLVKDIGSYVRQSLLTIIRIFITYRPLRFFSVLGTLIFGLGFLIGARFLYFYLVGSGSGHVQSLVLASLLMSTGFVVLVTGIIADLISVNRKLLEEVRWRVRKIEEKVGQFE